MEASVNQTLVKGTRWVLIGAIWYLLEWAFIVPFQAPALAQNSTAEELARLFASNMDNIPFYFIGIGLISLGRLLLIAALRRALWDFERARLPLDFAFACSLVAVMVENITYGFNLVAFRLATYSNTPPLEIAAGLLRASSQLLSLFNIPHGLFVASAAIALLNVRSVPRWIGWLGLIYGLGYSLAANLVPVADRLKLVRVNVEGSSWIGIAVWMLAIGVTLFRRAAKQAVPTIPIPSSGAPS